MQNILDIIISNNQLMVSVYVVLMLLIGFILLFVARKIKVSNILILLMAGIGAGYATYNGKSLTSVPNVLLVIIGLLALSVIVFDISYKLKRRVFDTTSKRTLWFSMLSFLSIMVIISFAANFIFGFNWIYSLVFSAILTGTEPILRAKKMSRPLEILEFESVINGLIAVFIPVIVLEAGKIDYGKIFIDFYSFFNEAKPFAMILIIGIGTGVLMGLIGAGIMRHNPLKKISPLIILVMSLLTYLLAENLDGNGFIAIVVMGLFYGYFYVKDREIPFHFSDWFANPITILAVMLIGSILKIKLTMGFIYGSLLLFFIYLAIRFVVLEITLGIHNLRFKEKIFIVLNCQKGLLVCMIMIFAFAVYGITEILPLLIACIVYSSITSTIAALFTKKVSSETLEKY